MGEIQERSLLQEKPNEATEAENLLPFDDHQNSLFHSATNPSTSAKMLYLLSLLLFIQNQKLPGYTMARRSFWAKMKHEDLKNEKRVSTALLSRRPKWKILVTTLLSPRTQVVK